MASRPKKYKLTAEDVALMQRMADEEAGVGGPRGSALRDALKGSVGGGGGGNDSEDESVDAAEAGGLSDDDGDDDDNDDDAGGSGGSGDADLPPALMAMAGLVNNTNAGLADVAAADVGMAGGGDDDDDDASDDEDYVLQPGDTVLLAAKSQEDYSSLEVHVYNPDEGNLFVHHDISMPTFPLCVEWLNFATSPHVDLAALAGGGGSGGAAASGSDHSTPGSFAAIGTFGPGIEIFDLDVLEALEPDVTLGGPKASAGGRGAGGGRRLPASALKDGSHTGAVMALSWNRGFRNLLASGSADGTAKVWDLATQQCRMTLQHHKGKVQSVEWNPAEQNILATGSFDRTAAVVDARAPKHGSKFALPADVEDLQWNPHAPFQLYAGCEDGTLLAHDLRQGQRPLFRFAAHGGGKPVSSLAFSQYVPGMLATCSTDRTVKIWDLLGSGATAAGGVGAAAPAGAGAVGAPPQIVVSKNMNSGPLFSVRFFPGNPFLLATAGEEGLVAIWESDEDAHVARAFGASRRLEAAPVYRPKTSGAASASASSSSSSLPGGAAEGAQISAGTTSLEAGGGGGKGKKGGKKGAKKKK